MKKFFLLIICSAFSAIINAQTFYVYNDGNTYDLDVTSIGMFFTVCNSAPDCNMGNLTSIAAGTNTSLGYPAGCGSNDYIMMNIALVGTTFSASISYCGTAINGMPTGLFTGEKYSLGPVAGGVRLKIHY